jgi:hypothetical protein
MEAERDRKMSRKYHMAEQIIRKLPEAEVGLLRV